LPREVERPLLIEMRQPPVAQRDRLAGFVAAALQDVALGVGGEQLPRLLVGQRDRRVPGERSGRRRDSTPRSRRDLFHVREHGLLRLGKE
jgi:hypothetical protein